MYAAIQRHPASGAPDERLRAGRALASRLGAVPGFVAYLLVEEPDGACVAVSLFTDRAGLEAAEHLVGDWLAAHADVHWLKPAALAAGEVIAAKGL